MHGEVEQPEAWYHLGSSPKELYMDLRADLLEHIKQTNPKTIEGLRQEHELGEFSFPDSEHGELGFDGVLKVGGSEYEGWVRISSSLEGYHQEREVEDDDHEEEPFMDRYLPRTHFDYEKAKPLVVSWSVVHRRTVNPPEVEPVTERPQLVTVETRYTDQPTIGANIYPAMTRWVASDVNSVACKYGTETMRAAHSEMSHHFRPDWTEVPNCEVECTDDGHIMMKVPGPASVFHTDNQFASVERLVAEGHGMSTSNVTNSLQTLTLLAGLSKLEWFANNDYRDHKITLVDPTTA